MISPSSLLLLLFQAAENNRIDGRTAIQKMMYFAISKSRGNFGYEYKPHYYGPYSSQVSAMMEHLVSLGLVEEQQILTNNERKLYSYFLTSKGMNFSENLPAKYPKTFKVVKKVVEAVDSLEDNKIELMSCAAKVHHLVSHSKESLRVSSAIKKARSLGWNLSESQIHSSVALLEKIYSPKQ